MPKSKGTKLCERYLRANEFEVRIEREGWGNVAKYLKDVKFAEFPEGKELRLEFVESRDLDVLVFFTEWVLSKKSHDVFISLGSGKRGLLFSACSVDSVMIDDLDASKDAGKINVNVILRYVAVFVVDKERDKVLG
jgi:hypothetical protein